MPRRVAELFRKGNPGLLARVKPDTVRQNKSQAVREHVFRRGNPGLCSRLRGRTSQTAFKIPAPPEAMFRVQGSRFSLVFEYPADRHSYVRKTQGPMAKRELLDAGPLQGAPYSPYRGQWGGTPRFGMRFQETPTKNENQKTDGNLQKFPKTTAPTKKPEPRNGGFSDNPRSGVTKNDDTKNQELTA